MSIINIVRGACVCETLTYFLLKQKEKRMNLKPLNDRVVVKPLGAETRTAGGIVIPDSAQEKPTTGKVVAIGDGRVLENGTTVSLNVKSGDTVLYGKHSGQNVKIDGDELVVLKEEEIFAVVEN